MPSSPSNTGNHELPKGLPPVTPPSGRFIIQLFLVPGLIVTVAVLIYLGASHLVGSSYTPESFLKDLDSSNPDIRWRGAHSLAQILERPESVALASDTKFALDLAERLDKAVEDLERVELNTRQEIDQAEKAAAQKKQTLSEEDVKAFWRRLRSQRDHVSFLIGCVSHFTVPVGAPALCEIAVKETGPEIVGLTDRRRKAVLALSNLGDSFKRRYLGIDPQEKDVVLTPERKDSVIAALKQELGSGGKRAEWAKQTLVHLEGKQPAGFVDGALAKCAGGDDPFLRELVALALNFWDGDVEPILIRLANDDGRGKLIKIAEDD
jgi:hypothetical protein